MAKEKRAFLMTGAYNPPTVAHEAIIDSAADGASSDHSHFYVGVGASEEKEDAPLTFKQKEKVIIGHQKILSKRHKSLSFGVVPRESSISPFHQIVHLIEKEGHNDITVGLGSDQLVDEPGSSKKSLKTQIETHIKKYGGFLGSDRKTVHPVKITFKQLGTERKESDYSRGELLQQIKSGDFSGVKGGKLRKAVESGDTELAKAMMPRSVHPEKYFDLIMSQQEKIKKAKPLKESYNTWFCPEEFIEYKLENVIQLLLEEKTKEEQRRYQNQNKRNQRAKDSATMDSNPFSGKIMIVRDKKGHVLIIDKHSYKEGMHEIVVAPDKMNKGAATKTLDDPDFMNTDTSIRLFGKVQGAEDSKETKSKNQKEPKQEKEEEQPQEVPAPLPPQPTITDTKSQYPDSDHSATDMEAGIVAAHGLLKGIPLEDQVKVGMIGIKDYEKLMSSQTLLPAGQRTILTAVDSLKKDFPDADFEMFHYGTSKDQKLSEFYRSNGARDNTPKSDLIFRDKNTGGVVGVSVKCGPAQLISAKAQGEAQALLKGSLELTPPESLSEELRKSVENILNELNQLSKSGVTKEGPVGDYLKGGSKEGEDEQLTKAKEIHDKCTQLLRKILISNKDFTKALVYEALTGTKKFDTGKKNEISPAVAQYILSMNKDGTRANLSKIDEEYAEKIAGLLSNIRLRFKSTSVKSKKQEGKAKIYNYWSVFALGTKKPLNEYFRHNNILREIMNQEEPSIDEIIEFLKQEIGGDPLKLMEFLEIECDAIGTDMLDFSEVADKDYDNVNIIVVNGKEIEIPVERDIDYNDMSSLEDDMVQPEESAEESEQQELKESYIDFALRFLSERAKVDKASGRDYKKEYKWQGTARQKKRRAQRNKARAILRKAGRVHKGDGKDVDHKNHNTGDNSSDNLRVMSASSNRSKK